MNRQERAEKFYEIIKRRYDEDQPPLRNTELGWELGYADQQIVIQSIPDMQRLARGDGLMLARPHPANGWSLTLTPYSREAIRSEIARFRNRAGRQQKDVAGGILEQMQLDADPEIRFFATVAAAANEDAVIADKRLSKRLADLDNAIRSAQITIIDSELVEDPA